MVLIARPSALLRGLMMLALVVSTVGCIDTRPPTKLNEPAPVTTAYLLSYPDRPDISPVPDEVTAGVEEELGMRNLQPRVLEFSTYGARFERLRDTRDRLEFVASESEAPFVLLVETRVRFYSLLNGRYRWDVNGRITFAPRDDLGRAQSDEFDFAAFLQFEHQDEQDALRYVERSISKQVAMATDRFLRGREDVSVTTSRAEPDPSIEDEPGDPGAEAAPGGVTAPFEPGDAIYFVMLDRFHNGVPANDESIDPDDPHAWHGGDIAGLTEKLDYLDRLGISHIWMSPVWDARDTKFHGHGAFHGYWTEDLGAIEPRLGTEKELAELARRADERDIGLLLDMVLNHVGPDAPLVSQKPGWFHGLGGITDWSDPKQVTDHDVHGLPDLDQDNPEVYDHLLGTSVGWARKLRPAGFRLDAVKHVSNDFWQKYNRAMQKESGERFVLLGEVLDGNPRVTAEAMRDGNFNALFDFPLHFALVDVFCRDAHPGRIGAVLGADRLYPDFVHQARRRGLVTLLDNHDLPRIASLCGETSKVESALQMMMALRGTPSFTWGTEIPLKGADEPANRADMDFDAQMELATTIRSGIARRTEHPVLIDGRDQVLELTADRLVLARILPDAAAIVVWDNDGEAEALAPRWFRGEVVEGAMSDGRIDASAPVSVTIVRGDFSDEWRERGAMERREVVVEVSGAPGPVRLAGSAPEVGAWRFEGALPVEDGRVRFELPVGEVVALKLAATVDGEEVWEERTDRFVLVEDAEQPLELTIGWER